MTDSDLAFIALAIPVALVVGYVAFLYWPVICLGLVVRLAVTGKF